MQTTLTLESVPMTSLKQKGFTLYELLITLLVIGVVLTIGVPNLTEFRQNSRMAGSANDLIAAFQQARTESARAKTNVTICASATPADVNANCNGEWADGYIIFLDTDGDIARDAGEEILRSQGNVAEGVNFRVAGDATFFSYGPSGLGRGDVGGNTAITQIVLCDARGTETAAGGSSAARLFVTTPLGRATILKDDAAIATALTNMGKGCP